MALDELFTYLGISGIVGEINETVKNSAKPVSVGKTALEYDLSQRVSKVGRLGIKYNNLNQVRKIGEIYYRDDWLKLAKRLGKTVRNSLNEQVYMASCPHLSEREFDWHFANCGVAVFACDCNILRYTNAAEQPLQIENNAVCYDQDGFVINVGGLKVGYTERDPSLRSSAPDIVGGIIMMGSFLISLNIVKEADLIDG